jgi:alkyl hydroperoxide reductase subunit AhpC
VNRPSRGDALWIALPVVATLRRSLSRRFGVHVEAGASIPLQRRQFVIDGVGAVFRPAAVAVRAALGVEVYF